MRANKFIKSYLFNKFHNLFLILFGGYIFYTGYGTEIIQAKLLFMPLGFLSFYCGVVFLLAGMSKVDAE